MLILTLISLTLASLVLLSSIRNLQNTTLLPAGCWAITGLATWWTAVLCESLQFTGPGLVDLLFYTTSVLLLCPGIAVLGARRPGYRIWNFFVLLPLIAVQIFPAIAGTQFLHAANPFRLDVPSLLGFHLVLVMGTANYFGTRFTLPAVLHMSTLVLIVCSMTDVTANLLPATQTARQCAAVTFMLSTSLAALRGGETSVKISPLDRTWLDFVDQFGLVWANRVMTRLNESARHESWAADFHWHGIQWAPDATVAERHRTEERISQTLRWILKRYVNTDWIDTRLTNPENIQAPHAAADSTPP